MSVKRAVGELNSPRRSIRLQAIEICLQQGNSEEVLQALAARRAVEDDAECALLLEQAENTVRRRLESKSETALERNETEADFEQHDVQGRLKFLLNLSPAGREALARKGLVWLNIAKHPLVISSLLKIFGPYWSESELSRLVGFLADEHLSTRMAALELLVERAPRLILEALPPLLASPEPRVRVMAIQGLAKLDMDEAVRHLENMLLNGDSWAKSAAVRSAFQLPFEALKPSLLKFFAMEANPELLDEAGLLFAINPDPEVPYRLWEVAESSPAAKRDIIKRVLQQACQAIKDAGLIREEFPQFVEKLQKWIYLRSARRFIQDVILRWQESGADQDGLFARIEASFSQAWVRKMWSEALAWPMPETLKARLQALQAAFEEKGGKEPAPTSAGDGSETVSSSAASQAGSADALDLVGIWEFEDRAAAEPRIREIMARADLSDQLFGTAMRAATRLKLSGFVSQAEEGLKRKEPVAVSAALEYLGAFDPDRIFPLLGRYVKHQNGRVKGSAIRILKQYDPAQAISSLRTMLFSSNHELREAALGTVIHFDFALVRPLLVELIRSSPDPVQQANALLLFQANPEVENLFFLYSFGKQLPKAQSELSRRILKENIAFLIETGQLKEADLGRLEQEWSRRWSAEEEKRTKPKPAYALENVISADETGFWRAFSRYVSDLIGIGPSELSFGKRLMQILRQRKRLIIAVCVGIPLLNGVQQWWSERQVQELFKKGKPGTVLSVPLDLYGTVKQVEAKSVMVESSDARAYIVNITPEMGEPPKAGDRFSARVLPLRISPSGHIVARYMTRIGEQKQSGD